MASIIGSHPPRPPRILFRPTLLLASPPPGSPQHTNPGIRHLGCTRAPLSTSAGTSTGAPPPGRQPSAVRPASRGSSGHAWSAGFDWAAVVVVTGRRRRSGLTVPGAARSPPLVPAPPWLPQAPELPAPRMASVRVRSPPAVRADPMAAGPGREDPRPGSSADRSLGARHRERRAQAGR